VVFQASPSVIHRIFEEAFNQGDLTIVDELVAPEELTSTLRRGAPSGRSNFKSMILTYRTAFPDLHCTVEDEILQEDKVAAWWTIRGTQRGMFLGIRPTHRPIKVRGFIFARIAGGLIIEEWIMIDELRILQQLGLVPPL
jgi:steroid delta-isomerase-like uncharacterized protein